MDPEMFTTGIWQEVRLVTVLIYRLHTICFYFILSLLVDFSQTSHSIHLQSSVISRIPYFSTRYCYLLRENVRFFFAFSVSQIHNSIWFAQISIHICFSWNWLKSVFIKLEFWVDEAFIWICMLRFLLWPEFHAC